MSHGRLGSAGCSGQVFGHSASLEPRACVDVCLSQTCWALGAVTSPCWCHLCLGTVPSHLRLDFSPISQPWFLTSSQDAFHNPCLGLCLSCCCRYHQLLPVRVCLFFSSFYGLTDTKTVEAHKFRVSKGSCGLRHAKKCQWWRVTLVVSDCLFVLLSRSRCYGGYLGKEEKGCVAQRIENLLTSVNCCFQTQAECRREREGLCFGLSTLRLKSFNFLLSFSFCVLQLENLFIKDCTEMIVKQWQEPKCVHQTPTSVQGEP